MCIFSAVKPPKPQPPIKPIEVAQNIVGDRSDIRRRATLIGAPGQNRTLLAGTLVAPPANTG